jgi:hypothetical protein
MRRSPGRVLFPSLRSSYTSVLLDMHGSYGVSSHGWPCLVIETLEDDDCSYAELEA